MDLIIKTTIRKAMSARNTKEEDQDSDYSDVVQDSEDEDYKCNKEEDDEGEDKQSEEENCSASIRTQVFLVVIFCLLAQFYIH